MVVWEADDADLKRRLRLGVDLHLTNGIELEGIPMPPEDELIDGHPNFPVHLARYKKQRKFEQLLLQGMRAQLDEAAWEDYDYHKRGPDLIFRGEASASPLTARAAGARSVC